MNVLQSTSRHTLTVTPNVFYSCDALAHAETMVLTYGTGDAAIGCRCPNYLTD